MSFANILERISTSVLLISCFLVLDKFFSHVFTMVSSDLEGEGIYPFLKSLILDVLDEIAIFSLIISSDVQKRTCQILNFWTLIKKNNPYSLRNIIHPWLTLPLAAIFAAIAGGLRFFTKYSVQRKELPPSSFTPPANPYSQMTPVPLWNNFSLSTCYHLRFSTDFTAVFLVSPPCMIP